MEISVNFLFSCGTGTGKGYFFANFLRFFLECTHSDIAISNSVYLESCYVMLNLTITGQELFTYILTIRIIVTKPSQEYKINISKQLHNCNNIVLFLCKH